MDFDSNVTQDSSLRSSHNMSDQRQKEHRFVSVPSSLSRASRSRPPLPNEIQAELQCSSSSPPGASASPESLVGSSTILLRIDDSQTVNESANQQNLPNLRRRSLSMLTSSSGLRSNNNTSIAMLSEIGRVDISGGNFSQNINIRKVSIILENWT